MLTKIGNVYIDLAEIAAARCASAQNEAEHADIVLRSGEWIVAPCTEEALRDVLMRAGMLADEESEATPPGGPFLEDGELDTLRELYSKGFRYLARDKDRTLYAFQQIPQYNGAFWDYPQPSGLVPLRVEGGFDFIDEEDAAPTEIVQLIAPYLDA